MYSLKLLNRQGSKLYKANATDVPKPRVKLERAGEIEYIALEERENEGAEVGFVVDGKWVYPAKPQPIMDGLICWLDGRDGSNEEQTSVWVDRSGNGNDAVLNGFNTTTCWTGNSLQFGSSTFCGLNGIVGTYSAMTVEMYISDLSVLQTSSEICFMENVISNPVTNSWSYRAFFTHLNHGGAGHVFDTRHGAKRVQVNPSTFGGRYIRAVLVTEKGVMKVYRNEILISQLAIEETECSINIASAFLGNGNYKNHITRIYNRALTEAEILHNYEYEQSK